MINVASRSFIEGDVAATHAGRIPACILFLLTPAVCLSAMAATAPVEGGAGIYTDRNGAHHRWHITKTHTLIWDGKPYLPIGGMFNSAYLFWEQHPKPPPNRNPENDFRRTCLRLDLLRRYGLDDLYLNFCTPSVPPRVVQRVVDALEARGFRYGIEITSSPSQPCLGYVIEPEKFRVPVKGGLAHVVLDLGKEKLKAPERVRIRWAARGPSGPIAAGTATAERRDGQVLRFDLNVPKAATTVVFSPEVKLNPGDPSAMFAGYSAYEHKLAAWLRAIRFGPGLRFVVDPFRNELQMSANTIPTHKEFISGLERYLLRRYGSIGRLNDAWAATPAFASFASAARVIPLQSDIVVGPQGELHRIGRDSAFFDDVGRRRAECAERFCNRIADAIKSVHDVPVIFKHNVSYKRMFSNNQRTGGFDGVGWESYGVGASLVVHNGGTAFAEAAQADRPMWSVVTETSPAAFETQKSEIGYVSREAMYDAFDTLLRAGAKGIFVFGFTFDPPGGFMTSEVIRDPRNLEWMATYKRILEAAADRITAYQPVYAYCYPAAIEFSRRLGRRPFAIDGHIAAGKIFPLSGGSWVLPAERTDIDTPLPLRTRDRATMVRQCLRANDDRLRWPTLAEFRRKVLGYEFLPSKGKTARLYWLTKHMLGAWDVLPLPKRKVGGNAAIAYGFYYDTFDRHITWTPVARPPDQPLSRAGTAIQSYVEGEDAEATNFNMPREDGYCAFSGGLALTVYCTDIHPEKPFFARWRLTVDAPGDYRLWVRERTLKAMGPCRFRIDDGPWTNVPPDLEPHDRVRLDWWSAIFHGQYLAWYCYGLVHIQHRTVRITVQALPDASGRIEKHIDALRLEPANAAQE